MTASEPLAGPADAGTLARKLVPRYGLGLTAALLAIVIRLPLWVVVGTTLPYLTFYPAIILSAWYCGFGPGMLTAFFSAMFVLYGMGHGDALRGADYYTGAMFLVVGLITAAIANSLRVMRERSLESQEKLRISEERSKYILESISDGFVGLDPRFCITNLNSAAERILGVNRQDLVGRDFWQQFPEQAGGITDTNFRCTMRQKESLRFEYLDPKTDRWFEIASYPSNDDGISVFFRDITSRKLNGEALRLSEERFRVVLQQSPITVFNLDSDLNVTWIYNAQAALAVDSPAAPAEGRPVVGVFPAALASRITAAANEVLRSGSGSRFYHSVRAEAGMRAYDITIEPLRDAEMQVTGITGAMIDITASKQVEEALSISEERLRMANEAAHMGVWNHDLVTNKVEWSDELERVFGLQPGEFGGTPEAFFNAIHPDDRDRVNATVNAAVGRLSDFEMEFRYVLPSGDVRWMLARGRVYAGESANPCRIAGVGMDITDRRKLDEKVRHAAKLESLGVLAGGIAHDFNNLLTGILGNASLLKEMVPAANSSGLLQNVIRASERAAQLSRQMLAYSGRGQFSVQPIDLSRQVREFVSFIETTISKNVAIRLRVADSLPLVEGDEGQLQQVIMNLVVNAAEAIGEREGWVEVSTRSELVSAPLVSDLLPSQELSPGDYIVLQVSDNGSGMDDITRAKIFDPFFTTKFTGRGLGLAAVLGIIRGHRGTIRVSSHPGVGTCFQVYFPATGKSLERSLAALSNDSIHGSGTILVVDDEEIVRVAARTVLENFGYNILEAENGREGLRVYDRHRGEVCVVLLDMTMPVMSGVETMQKLLQMDREVVVIATSGYNESEAMQIFGSSISGFIQKPFTAPDLGRKIKLASTAALNGKIKNAQGTVKTSRLTTTA
ncbi:MAG TPA: PAS domain S-box protein [Bryobacteraceae bacterium]